MIISGGNIDMNLLDRIINLGLAQEGRFFRFSTRLPIARASSGAW